MIDYQEHRFGRATPASVADMRRASMINGRGFRMGFDLSGKFEITQPQDGGTKILGGAGSGKSLWWQEQWLDRMRPEYWGGKSPNVLEFDPRGENDAVTRLAKSLLGYSAWTIDPYGIGTGPQHKTNPFDDCSLDNPNLIANAQKRTVDMIALPQQGSRWPYEDARNWHLALILANAEKHGVASLPGVHDLLCMMQGDVMRWCDELDEMAGSRFPLVRKFSEQIAQLQRLGQEGFTAPYSVLETAYAPMHIPQVRETFSGSDFSLQDLATADKMNVVVIWPAEYLASQSMPIRACLSTGIQSKFGSSGGPPLIAFLEEMGQITASGPLDCARQAFSFGRGENIYAVAAWQEESQLFSGFGAQADEITGSARYALYKGIRTPRSASLVSSMAGVMTLPYDDTKAQSDARRLRQHAAKRLMDGQEDMIGVISDMRHYSTAETHQLKMQRKVLFEDEVINLPSNQFVGFASGVIESMFQGIWIPHYTRRSCIGRALPNPKHDAESVTVPGFFRDKKLPVVEECVPEKLSRLPQYRGGTWTYIKGHRPNIRRSA